MCGVGFLHLTVLAPEEDVIVGGMDIVQVGYMFTDASLIDWQYEARQTFSGIWGAAAGTTVTGAGWCEGDCITSSQSYPTAFVTEGGVWGRLRGRGGGDLPARGDRERHFVGQHDVLESRVEGTRAALRSHSCGAL